MRGSCPSLALNLSMALYFLLEHVQPLVLAFKVPEAPGSASSTLGKEPWLPISWFPQRDDIFNDTTAACKSPNLSLCRQFCLDCYFPYSCMQGLPICGDSAKGNPPEGFPGVLPWQPGGEDSELPRQGAWV